MEPRGLHNELEMQRAEEEMQTMPTPRNPPSQRITASGIYLDPEKHTQGGASAGKTTRMVEIALTNWPAKKSAIVVISEVISSTDAL